MPAPCGPPWTRLYATRRYATRRYATRPAGYVSRDLWPSGINPGLRLSDAERAEVAERLSRHYADGRLDEAEFNERLDRAMKAKTHGDLSGLFADLPPGSQESEVSARQRHPRRHHRGRRQHRILPLILIIVVAAVVGQALAHSFIPWLLIALLAFIWLRHGPSRQGRS